MSAGGDKALPAGTLTFVFTDIEGSTRLVQQLGEALELTRRRADTGR